MDVQLKRGFLEISVLASMLSEDTYGYKLVRDISPFIEISESTLYPILRRLETSGCVGVYSTEHNGRLRKYYSITDEGRRRIGEFLSEQENIKRLCDYIKGEYEDDKTRIH